MHSLVIRAARLDEYDLLDQLMRRATLARPEYRDYSIAHPESLHIPHELVESGHTLVAERDGDISGFAAWLPIGEMTVELRALLVDPACWRGGVGTILIEAVSQAVVQNGRKQLYVVAPPGYEPFYRRSGFVRTGVTATEFGPALTMLMEIAN